MTNQEKKAFLNRYREAINEIDSITEEMARIRSNAMRITPVITDMPKGGYSVNNKLQEAIEQLEACANRIQPKVNRLHEEMLMVEKVIDAVTDKTLQQLLRYKYINGYGFEVIAVKMNYSWRHTIRLHGKALSAVDL
jgi:uncharacterized protein Yka (UPF0111/DUF47 family)